MKGIFNCGENVKNIIAKIAIVVVILAIICSVVANVNKKTTETQTAEPITNSEILRALTYEQITEEEENNQDEYVKFLAFFTRDLDGDGYAEKLKGTCREISATDELYIDFNVLTDGYLKDGVITLNAPNFIWKTAIVSDNIVDGNYLGNTTSIKLQDKITTGSQKMIWGTIHSNVGNNINNYTNEATITLTGTHVSDNTGKETPINKTVKVIVDWYGYVGANIKSTSINKDLKDIKTTENTVKFDVDIETQEPIGKLLLKENVITAEIPQFNGYDPVKVTAAGDYTYDEQTRILTVKNTSVVDEEGKLTKTISRQQSYKVSIEYPIEAYIIDATAVTLEIPVSTYYVAYNNNNEQFTNPIQSTTANEIVALTYRKPLGYTYEFDVRVGKISRYGYTVSKEKPREIYNGKVEETIEDYYNVVWELARGNEGEVSSVTMKETPEKYSDEFLNADNQYFNMINYIENIGIYFSGATKALGENGFIKVYNDETNELIHEFTKEDWSKYTASNIYKYEQPVKHIRIETSAAAQNSIFTVNNIKEINDELLINDFSEDEFDKLSYIYSYLQGTAQLVGNTQADVINDIGIAKYLDEVSCSSISISSKQIKTEQTVENFRIYIDTIENIFNDAKWKNSQFLVKIPSEIVNTQINSISTNNKNVQIIGYELFEKSGSYFIKVVTQNETEEEFRITIDCNITPDPATKTCTRDFELYSYNEIAEKYYNSFKDIYDVNGNNNKQENIDFSITSLDFVAPSNIITSQYISNYNEENNIKIAPNVADIMKEQKTANINLVVLNNYTQNIDEVKILGVIPTEGNSYIVNGKELGSEFSVNMSNTGIQVPDELKNVVKIYYSEKMNPTKELNNSSNGWKANPDDWSKVKTFLIDFGNYIIPAGVSYTFSYEIQVPNNIEYNKISYSEHAVYFTLDTEGGKLATQTEPNKLGIRIARYFGVNLTKYRLNTNIMVGGATYKFTEKDENGTVLSTKLLTTKDDGKALVTNLYVGRKYTLQEIVTPNYYELNNDEIEFYVTEKENGELQITVTSEDKFSTEPIMNNEEDIVYVTTEDMPKYNLVLNKVSTTGEKLKSVTFDVKEKNRVYKTNESGQLLIENLTPNETYTIIEKRADGYYVDSTEKKLKLVYNKDKVEIETNDEELKSAIITNDDSLPYVNVEVTITNEKIPTYTLEVLKVEKNNKEDLKPLKDAKFNLEYKDLEIEKIFETDENGKIVIENLYQYVEGKYISGTYVLQEIEAPAGYVNNAEKISFRVSKNAEGNLNAEIENEENIETIKEIQVDGDTIKIIIEDLPIFKMTKIDAETKAFLPNVKFMLYEIDEKYNVIDFAKDVNGNYVGQINENGEYIVTVDENGSISLPLKEGLYKAVETEFLEGYDTDIGDTYFEISSNRKETNVEDVIEINYIEDLVDLANDTNVNKNNYSGKTIKLMRNLDFNNTSHYKNANSTVYGDLNENRTVESLMVELTSGYGFMGIGYYYNVGFSGTFDGQGYEIRNLYMNRGLYGTGLFIYVKNATIKNLTVTGDIRGASPGLIVYTLIDSTLENCSASGSVEGIAKQARSNAGGLVGTAINSNIINCRSSKGLVISANIVGGIVGDLASGVISNCYNECEILDTYYSMSIGGIVGKTGNGLATREIYNCYNLVDLGQDGNIGGIVSEVTGYINIRKCYNIGNINGKVSSRWNSWIYEYEY